MRRVGMLFFGRHALLLVAMCSMAGLAGSGEAAELLIGASSVDITPPQPVALDGQMHTRISKGVDSPVTATAVALETRDADRSLDQAVLVSCDLTSVRDEVRDNVRELLKARAPGLDPMKVVFSATHTHTAPVVAEGKYDLPAEGIMQPGEYREFLVGRLAELVVRAWEARKPGAVSWGLGHAVIGQNRRAVYADGRGQMYGRTDQPHFRHIEGYEDHSVDVLFFWDAAKTLMAVGVNVACPAQEVEGLSVINADFWHETREALRQRFGPDLMVLGWTGAAGDQSPHLMYNRRAEERMRTLRGLTRLGEIARRLSAAVDEAYQVAQNDLRTDVVLAHRVEALKLPARMVTEQEAAQAKAQVDALSNDPRQHRRMQWHQAVVERFKKQKDHPLFEMELHVIRLGDVAITTNPFELFVDYGIQIKARSKAVQTLILQLTGAGSYLPTERAVRAGGYSAIVESSVVGPEGGQVLVDRIVALIGELWPE